MDKQRVCWEAIELWGEDAQILKCVEECTELALVLLHAWRNKTDIEDIASEIADVEIMCVQMRLIFDNEIIDRVKKFKWIRLKNRIFKAKERAKNIA